MGIESHGNRYFADYDTLYFHELLSGYIDGEYFVPIRFGIKEYKDKTAKIYVIISNEKIKTEVIAPATTDKTVKTGARSVIFSVPENNKSVNKNNSSGRQYSFGGESSETANLARLNEAIQR